MYNTHMNISIIYIYIYIYYTIYYIYNDSWDAHPGRVPARQDMSWEWAAEAPNKSLVVFSSMLCSFPGGISCL